MGLYMKFFSNNMYSFIVLTGLLGTFQLFSISMTPMLRCAARVQRAEVLKRVTAHFYGNKPDDYRTSTSAIELLKTHHVMMDMRDLEKAMLHDQTAKNLDSVEKFYACWELSMNDLEALKQVAADECAFIINRYGLKLKSDKK